MRCIWARTWRNLFKRRRCSEICSPWWRIQDWETSWLCYYYNEKIVDFLLKIIVISLIGTGLRKWFVCCFRRVRTGASSISNMLIRPCNFLKKNTNGLHLYLLNKCVLKEDQCSVWIRVIELCSSENFMILYQSKTTRTDSKIVKCGATNFQ